MAASLTDPTAESVAELYDQINRILIHVQGGSMHYGYWDGPDDESSVEQAAERLIDIMIEKLDVRQGDRVLDVGCGPGRPGVKLAGTTGAEVVGISVSTEDVKLANARAESEGLRDQARFERADALDLPYPDHSFDRALALESIVHVPDRVRVLSEIARVLRPGGRVSLTDFIAYPHEEQAEVDGEPGATESNPWQTAPTVTPEDYESLAAQAGLVIDEINDITEHTKYSIRATYRALYAYARKREVPPALAEILAAGPGEFGVQYLTAQERNPSQGVIIVVAHVPEA